jgi:diguanylate cyclase (GGDEF)-like protein
MSRPRFQFRPRIFATATVVVAVTLLLIVSIPQWFSKQARLDVLRANVGQVARLAASTVDGDLHGQLIDQTQYTAEKYAQALQPLVRLHSTAPEIAYLYTMVVIDNKTFFVLDTANSPVMQKLRTLEPSAYMDPFQIRPEYDDDWLDQLAAGKTFVTPTFQQDDYGTFLTGHAPIHDSNGKYVGFVGVDYNLQYYLEQETRFNKIIIWSLASALIVSLLVGYLVARYEFTLHSQVQSHYQTSVRDQLTNLFNRRGVLQAVADSLGRHRKGSHATLIVDIDHFKAINDTYGHATGDDVIARLSVAIKNSIRTDDICARLGGDEFMIFAPNCDVNGARDIANRLLASIVSNNSEQAVQFTVSIGISVEIHAVATFDGLYRLADAALYQAKSEGKNRFAVYINA